MRKYTRRDPVERFMDYISPEPMTGCWLWGGGSDSKTGYGKFRLGRKDGQAMAHRFAYEHFIGPIPEGMQIDHLCRQRLCVNPEHLEPVTIKENVLRGVGLSARNAKATHCIHGHELKPENTYVWRGQRECRACKYARFLANKQERAAKKREWREKRRKAGLPVT